MMATTTQMGGTVAAVVVVVVVAAAVRAGTTRATRGMAADPAAQGAPMTEPVPASDPDSDLGAGAAGPEGAAILTKGPQETV
jgi:hypothetical protein